MEEEEIITAATLRKYRQRCHILRRGVEKALAISNRRGTTGLTVTIRSMTNALNDAIKGADKIEY